MGVETLNISGKALERKSRTAIQQKEPHTSEPQGPASPFFYLMAHGGHRIWVSLILDMLADGVSYEEVLENFPRMQGDGTFLGLRPAVRARIRAMSAVT